MSTVAFCQQISKESLSQQAYLAIRGSLMRSRLRPGQKLVARQVADDLGISVTPVRESLLRLVSEHALVMDERGTVMVPEVSLARCLDIRGLRTLVEGEGAARAALVAATTAIDALCGIHERYVQTERDGDFPSALEQNETFHLTLCRMSQSPALFRIVENLWIQYGPILSHLYEGVSPPFRGRQHGHLKVIEALRRRDPDLSRRAIAEDITEGGGAMLEKLKQLSRQIPSD